MKRALAAVCAVVLAAGLIANPARAQKGKSPHKRLTLACEACHSAASFKDIHFDHSTTGYRLEGHHAVASCLACHNVEDFSKVDGACASCHRDVHRGRLGTKCEHCHAAGGWKVFDAEEIHADTDFPVMGRHLMVDCEGCHPGMPETDFRSAPSECVACHRADYEGVESPNHVQSGFSTDCRTCHQLMAWTPAVMSDHDAIFPIFSGAHRNRWAECSECHTSADDYRVFDCLTCHEQVVTDSHHAGMPDYSYASEACLSCHPTGKAAQFLVHDAQYFPVYSGTHVGQWTDCAACHTTSSAAFSCIDCHTHDQATVDPTHNGMPGYTYTSDACYFCHPTGEKGDFVDHDALYFPIFSGAHSGRWTDCTACHTTGTAAFSCIDCHDHEQVVTDSHHVGMDGYTYASDACYSCHPTGVAGQFLAHDAQLFPIYSGTHVGQWTDCVSCHTSGTTAFSCIDCHTHDPTAVDPTHNGMTGYSYDSQSCIGCHPTGEVGTFVDHDAQFFPIYSGRHAGTWNDCATCHVSPGDNNVFSCFECHDHEQVVTDSHHVGMDGYTYASDACYSCHPTGVAGQFLAHDAQYFPIYSGTHVGQWTDCVSCHTAGTAAFSCIDCHAHDQAAVDPTHNGMPGYSYDSQSCIGCHPTGEAGAFVDHDALYFPIYSGTHSGRWTDCAACHTTGTTAFSCIDCHTHDQAAVDPTHNGMTGYSYTSQACFGCHPTGEAGTFVDHDAQFFPIYSGRHAGTWNDCATCHVSPGDNNVFSCFECHTHDQGVTDSHHTGVSGYSYDSNECLRCHPNGRAEG